MTMLSDRTTIVIAHRLSTIRNADRIYVLQSGSVMEEGTHDTLLQKENGIYKEMVSLQSTDVTDSHENSDAETNQDGTVKQRNTTSTLLLLQSISDPLNRSVYT